jgi:hypothetical protein
MLWSKRGAQALIEQDDARVAHAGRTFLKGTTSTAA